MSELIDTGLDEEEVEAIRETLLATPGVHGLHELRTRQMADHALVDAHMLVDPRISVSEGHYIAETARARVLKQHHVLDVMVHIDPEDDSSAKPNAALAQSRRPCLPIWNSGWGRRCPVTKKWCCIIWMAKWMPKFPRQRSVRQANRSPHSKLQSHEMLLKITYFRSIQLH